MKNYKTFILSIFMYIFSISIVYSGDLSFIPYSKSIHLKSKENIINEDNWSIGFQYDFGDITNKWNKFVNIACFKDSIDNNSYYVAGGITRRFMISKKMKYLHIDTGFIGLLMTREDYFDNKIFPLILPLISVGTDKIAINISYVPKLKNYITDVLLFQIKINIK